MSAALLDDLLADYIAPARVSLSAPTLAKGAKAANREHPCGPAPDSEPCEDLRMSAKAEQRAAGAEPESQNFAALRNPPSEPQTEETCGSSQDSQISQGCPSTCANAAPLDLAAVAWTEADIARFLDRRARLLRWGWTEPQAKELADRLVRRDREADERVSCTDCQHYRPGRCGNHKRAGLCAPDLGRDLAAMLQRCPGFQPAK